MLLPQWAGKHNGVFVCLLLGSKSHLRRAIILSSCVELDTSLYFTEFSMFSCGAISVFFFWMGRFSYSIVLSWSSSISSSVGVSLKPNPTFSIIFLHFPTIPSLISTSLISSDLAFASYESLHYSTLSSLTLSLLIFSHPKREKNKPQHKLAKQVKQ